MSDSLSAVSFEILKYLGAASLAAALLYAVGLACGGSPVRRRLDRRRRPAHALGGKAETAPSPGTKAGMPPVAAADTTCCGAHQRRRLRRPRQL